MDSWRRCIVTVLLFFWQTRGTHWRLRLRALFRGHEGAMTGSIKDIKEVMHDEDGPKQAATASPILSTALALGFTSHTHHTAHACGPSLCVHACDCMHGCVAWRAWRGRYVNMDNEASMLHELLARVELLSANLEQREPEKGKVFMKTNTSQWTIKHWQSTKDKVLEETGARDLVKAKSKRCVSAPKEHM